MSLSARVIPTITPRTFIFTLVLAFPSPSRPSLSWLLSYSSLLYRTFLHFYLLTSVQPYVASFPQWISDWLKPSVLFLCVVSESKSPPCYSSHKLEGTFRHIFLTLRQLKKPKLPWHPSVFSILGQPRRHWRFGWSNRVTSAWSPRPPVPAVLTTKSNYRARCLREFAVIKPKYVLSRTYSLRIHAETGPANESRSRNQPAQDQSHVPCWNYY